MFLFVTLLIAIIDSMHAQVPGAASHLASVHVVHFGNAVYAVPDNMGIVGTDPAQPAGYEYYRFKFLLPGFEPPNASNAEKFLSVTGHNIIFGTIQYRPGVKLKDGEQNIFRGLPTPPPPHPHLEKVFDGFSKYVPANKFEDEFYFKNVNGRVFEFMCTQPNSPGVVQPKCHVLEQWDNGLIVFYAYDRTYAPDALALDKRLRALMDSFRVRGPK